VTHNNARAAAEMQKAKDAWGADFEGNARQAKAAMNHFAQSNGFDLAEVSAGLPPTAANMQLLLTLSQQQHGASSIMGTPAVSGAKPSWLGDASHPKSQAFCNPNLKGHAEACREYNAWKS